MLTSTLMLAASCCLGCQVSLLLCLQLRVHVLQLGDVKAIPSWVHHLRSTAGRAPHAQQQNTSAPAQDLPHQHT